MNQERSCGDIENSDKNRLVISFNNFFVRSLLVCAAILYFIVCNGGWLGRGSYSVEPELSFLTVASFVWFFVLFVYSLKSERNYWLLFPFILIAVPNAINDMFPSVAMGISGYYPVPAFSCFTHVDVYLVAGIVRFSDFDKFKTKYLKLAVFIALMSFVCSVAILTLSDNFFIYLMGSFQLRYYFLLCLLFASAKPSGYDKYFLRGFVLALLFLVFESVVFVLTKDAGGRLTSGNFGVNSLGHLLASGCVLLYFEKDVFENKWVRWVFFSIFIVSCFATGTRFSLIAIFLSIFIVRSIRAQSASKLVGGLISFFLFLIFIVCFTELGRSLYSGLNLVAQNLEDLNGIERTSDSSSMITRLVVWAGTLEMIFENVWFGVGPGVWSFLKGDYSIPFDGILDPHNDLLNYLVSYGLAFGTCFYFIVFILPICKIIKAKLKLLQGYRCGFFAFLVCLLLTGLTNAVSWKHQIAALIYFSSLLLLAPPEPSAKP